MRLLLSLLIILLTITSCDNAFEDIVYKEIKNVKIKNASKQLLELSGDLVLYNPNPVGVDLTQAQFDVYINNRKSVQINQDLDAQMPASSDFVIPITAQLSPQDLYGDKGNNLINSALQALINKKVVVKYDGSIRAGKGFMNFELPILDSLDVPIKLFK